MQGLDLHIKKLQNDMLERRNRARAKEEEEGVEEPFGWNETMSAVVMGYLRRGDRDVEMMVQSLEIVEPEALMVEGGEEYVGWLLRRFLRGGVVETG